MGTYYLIITLMTLGLYLIFLDLFKVPSKTAAKAVLSVGRQIKRNSNKEYEAFVLEKANKLSKLINLSIYKSSKLVAALRSAEIKMTPETYIARAYISAAIPLLLIIPISLILPILIPVIILLSVLIYYKESGKADRIVKKQREEIEYELPRFASTMLQELKSSRNVLKILEKYKKTAGKSMKFQLDITVADMKSGNYESALTRFETRIGSSSLSQVVRGLIGVLRGDDNTVYFQMLAKDLKELELNRLKTDAIKQPGKIKKYSFAMLICLVIMFLGVMAVQISVNLDQMF